MLCCDDVAVVDDDNGGSEHRERAVVMVDEFASESHRSIFVFILGLLIHVFLYLVSSSQQVYKIPSNKQPHRMSKKSEEQEN